MTYLYLSLFTFNSLLEGVREGYYWHFKPKDPFVKTNEHALFSLQRLILWSTMLFVVNWVSVLAIICMFPFLHDGAYYTTRNYLDKTVYPKRFFDESTTSTAKLTRVFTPVVRVLCALAGIIMLIIGGKI
jgi:hypothetical protein